MNKLTNLESEPRRVEFDPQSNVLVYQLDKRIEQEFFLVYENLLAALEECKPDSVMARFFIDVKEQLKNFEEAYPEIVSEYNFKHRP